MTEGGIMFILISSLYKGADADKNSLKRQILCVYSFNSPLFWMVLKHLFSVFSCINYSKAFPSFSAILLWMKELVSHKGNSRTWTLYQYQQKSHLSLRCQVLSLAHCYHLNLFIIYEIMAISFYFSSPQRKQWNEFTKDFWTLEGHNGIQIRSQVVTEMQIIGP